MFNDKNPNTKKIDLTIVTITEKIDEYLLRNIKSCSFVNLKYEQLIVIPKKEKQKTLDFKKNKNIRFVFDNGNGIYSAINIGMKHSIGNYILVLHGDNFLRKNSEKKIERSIKKGASFQFGCSLYENTGKTVNFLFHKLSFVSLLFGLYPPHPGLIIKREDYLQLGMYSEDYKICSDFDYYLKIFDLDI